MINLHLSDASIGVSVISLVTAIAAINRKPPTPPVVTVRTTPGKPTPRPTSDHPLQGKFTREELLGLARAAGVKTAKWRNGARKAELIAVLLKGGFIK